MERIISARQNTLRHLAAGLTALGLAAISVPLHAAELIPMAGESIDLGKFHGVVYYTDEGDEFRVVTTVAGGEDGSALRFSTMLAENQSATISVPGDEIGKVGQSLTISRSGDTVFVGEPENLSAITD